MTTAAMNGKTRKSLAEQIDRLDGILDGLAEALNQSVADAVQIGTREAVREAVIEVLTNPELRSLLAGMNVPPPVSVSEGHPSLVARAASTVKEAVCGVGQRIKSAVTTSVEKVQQVKRGTMSVLGGLGLAWRLKKILLVAVGVGVVTAVVSGVGSHTFASVLSGIGATISAVAVQAGIVVRRMLRLPMS